MTDIPTAIWSGSFNLFGVDIQCHTLSDGQRIIEAESVEKLIEGMAQGASISPATFEDFSKWLAK